MNWSLFFFFHLHSEPGTRFHRICATFTRKWNILHVGWRHQLQTQNDRKMLAYCKRRLTEKKACLLQTQNDRKKLEKRLDCCKRRTIEKRFAFFCRSGVCNWCRQRMFPSVSSDNRMISYKQSQVKMCRKTWIEFLVYFM